MDFRSHVCPIIRVRDREWIFGKGVEIFSSIPNPPKADKPPGLVRLVLWRAGHLKQLLTGDARQKTAGKPPPSAVLNASLKREATGSPIP